MEANELRIGNWINYFGSGDVCLTSKVELWNVFQDLELEYPKSRPIPLTEEWLLKFGFNRINEILFYDKGYKWKIVNYRIHFKLFRHTETETWFIANLEYVHQLQNLYFVLTENELEIKDNG